MQKDAVTVKRSEYAELARTILNECAGNEVEQSVFRQHSFLNWTVLQSSFLREEGLKVLVKDGSTSKRIVKGIVNDCKLLLGDSTVKKIDQIFTSYEEACEFNLRPHDLKGVVLLEELVECPTKIVREVIKEKQYFLYHPPGGNQFLAVILKNYDYILECLLFPGNLEGNSIMFSQEDPERRILLLGSVGMKPFDREFKIEKTKCFEIQRCISNEMNRILNEKNRRSSSKSYSHNFCRTPECLFRVPPIAGNCDMFEGCVLELLNVQRNPCFPYKYSPAKSPHFLSATVISCDDSSLEVKIIDGGKEITHHVSLSEGLLYPVGTAEGLGVEIRGEKTNEVFSDMQNVGGPEKYEGKEWRGFAELLMDDEESPYIRPIVIRNIHYGILAEFSFIDSMESGSMLFPLSDPHLLPHLFSKWGCGLPVRFDHSGLNMELLTSVFTDMRSDRVAVPKVSDLNAGDTGEENISDPSSVREDIPSTDMIYVAKLNEISLEENGEENEDGGVEEDEQSTAPEATREMKIERGNENGDGIVTPDHPLALTSPIASFPPSEDIVTEDSMNETIDMEVENGIQEEENIGEEAIDAVTDSLEESGPIPSNASPASPDPIPPIPLRPSMIPPSKEDTPHNAIDLHSKLENVVPHSTEDDKENMMLKDGEDTVVSSPFFLKGNSSTSGVVYTTEEFDDIMKNAGIRKKSPTDDPIPPKRDLFKEWIQERPKMDISHDDEAEMEEGSNRNGGVEEREEEKEEDEVEVVKELLSDADILEEELVIDVVTMSPSGERGDARREEDENAVNPIRTPSPTDEGENDQRLEGRLSRLGSIAPLMRTTSNSNRGNIKNESNDLSRDDRGKAIKREMLTDGIPSGSSDGTVESQKNSFDNSMDGVPAKKRRLPISMGNVIKNMGEDAEMEQKGEPLSQSFNPFELPRYHARKLAGRDSLPVRGGFPRASFLRETMTNNQERLITGDEEEYRIKMESVLKELKLLRFSSDKIVDMDILNRDLLTKFRHPFKWNALEVQLLLDQFDIVQPLKNYVKSQDFDGMCFFSLSFKEILNEFPNLDDEDFNEKMFFFSFIDRIRKIASDDSLVFN